MTYKEFVAKWKGKGINYDNFAGAQCMDVYRMYVKEVLGCPQSKPVTGAKDVWTTYLPEYFDRIANTPTGVPQQGDIVIWGMAPYGHIAICDSATTSTLTCFEQNWTELDGSGVSEIRRHGNYNNVLGWLRFKKQLPVEETMTTEESNILKFLKEQGANEGKVREAFGALASSPEKDKQIQTLQSRVLDLEKSQKDMGDRLTALESNIQADLELVENLKKDNSTLLKEVTLKNKRINELILLKPIEEYTLKELLVRAIKLITKK